MTNYERMKPDKSEIVYPDYDEEFGWGIFGVDSGFCYCHPSSEGEAVRTTMEMNGRRKHE